MIALFFAWTMQFSYCYLCYVCVAVSTSLARSLAGTMLHPDYLRTLRNPGNPLNSTVDRAVGVEVNPYIALSPVFEGPTLDQNSLLIATVQLLAREALEDINGQVPRTAYHSSDPRFSSVGVYVLPPTNAVTLQRRLLVWGLVMSLQFMMQEDRFASVIFILTQNGIYVGSVQFQLLDGGTAVDKAVSANESLASSSVPARLNVTQGVINDPIGGTNGTLAVGAPGLQVFYRLFGYDLEVIDVFRPIILLLRDVAEFQPHARCDRFKTPARIGETILRFKAESRIVPFFNTEMLVKAAAAVPLYMLNKGRFSEVDIEVKVDGILIAEGDLSINRTPRPTPNAAGNVSIY